MILERNRWQRTHNRQWTHHVLRYFSTHPLVHALEAIEIHVAQGVIGVKGDVRCGHNIRKAHQFFVLLKVLFVFQNIQQCISNLFIFQGQ